MNRLLILLYPIFFVYPLCFTLPVLAANNLIITMVSPSPLTNLASGYTNGREVKIADIAITNDQATASFTLRISGNGTQLGKLERLGGIQQSGDFLDFEVALKEGNTGILNVNSIAYAPALNTYQSFRSGDLTITFDVYEKTKPYATNKMYELWLRSSPATQALSGHFQVSFTATLTDD